ncbi:hypothetical protein EVAR_15743_1 [Eumeta japonica]|uniref:Uncharacterized protein n=1 Tax=Eumeta variegata TaxID=151549 RepID=A0A4C1Z5Y0_EUMVA|nr:hypothetical protein EVAR_15743_1 [Eumeta japonica]
MPREKCPLRNAPTRVVARADLLSARRARLARAPRGMWTGRLDGTTPDHVSAPARPPSRCARPRVTDRADPLQSMRLMSLPMSDFLNLLLRYIYVSGVFIDLFSVQNPKLNLGLRRTERI